ncbi:hypothetical protein JOF43_001404 [Brachybacterium sacelli]|uniref:Uncharacterized protein n=1 Tax=Brachybacterium sacelli TaxID=173364 RepID=A0ABS4WZ08_9MICO|nr:hypothetical protein [Brachybacterium sacelli]
MMATTTMSSARSSGIGRLIAWSMLAPHTASIPAMFVRWK